MGSVPRMHRCGVPRCGHWVIAVYWACSQHRALMDFVMNAEINRTWNERKWAPGAYSAMRAKVLAYFEAKSST
jgi:hypothetical protein